MAPCLRVSPARGHPTDWIVIDIADPRSRDVFPPALFRAATNEECTRWIMEQEDEADRRRKEEESR